MACAKLKWKWNNLLFGEYILRNYKNLTKGAVFTLLAIFILTPSFAANEKNTTIDDLNILSNPSFEYLRTEFKHYDEIWFSFLTSLAKGNNTDALKDLEELNEVKLNYAAKNISYYSYSLLSLSRMMENARDEKTALSLIDESLKLSPDIARIHFYKAAFLWRQNPVSNLFKVIDQYVMGIKDSISDIPTYTALVGNFIIVIIISLLALFALFSASLAIKYLPLISNDLKDKSAWEISPMLFSVLLLVFFIFLATFNLGFIWLLFFLTLPFFIYYTAMEKKITAIFYILLIITPVTLDYTSTMMLSTHRKTTDEILQIRNDIYTFDAEMNLKKWVEENSDDTSALFSLGLLNKKTGYLSDARNYYNEATESDSSYLKAIAINNLGNVDFIMKKHDSASALYEKSIEINSELVAPYFNLFKYYSANFDQENATIYHDEASKRSQKRILDFSETDIDSETTEPEFIALINRVVMDEDISDSELWSRITHSTENKKLADNLWDEMMKGISLRAAPIVGILALVILFGIGTLKNKYIISKACKFCGQSFTLKSLSHMEKRDACNKCFSLFIRREGVDPKTKATLRMSVDKINTRRNYFVRGINIIVPGFGHIYRGKAVKGFVFCLFYSLLLVQLFTYKGILVYPITSLGFPFIHNFYLNLLFFVILYIIAQRNFFKSELSNI